MSKPNPPASTIEFACPDEEVIVIRIKGRGSFDNSYTLRKIPEIVDRQFGGKNATRRVVLDLEHCATIDSTFIGEIARVGLAQMKASLGKLVLVNVNAHVHKILDTLGVSRLIEIHDYHPASDAQGEAFQAVDQGKLSKLDRIVMMLEAHEQLVDLNEDNNVRFRNVIDCLEAALTEEKESQGGPGK